MSNQFEFENAIREATRMDTSLSKAALSKPRKALENTNTSLNISVGEFNIVKLVFTKTDLAKKTLQFM